MASTSNRSLRRTLLARGISRRLIPQTRLAQLTAYAFALAVVFGLLLLGLRISGGSESAIGFAQWWFTASRIVAALLLFALALRWIRQRFLWSLRRRLFVAYFFIGVIPVVLVLLMIGIVAYLFAGQFGTYVAVSEIRKQLDTMTVRNDVIGAQMSQ